MRWNWQQNDWPRFRWDSARLAKAEERYLLASGVLIGAAGHLREADRNTLIVEAISGEALTTSEIEGEFLDRASVQSSIQRQLGLAFDRRRIRPAEQGISELIVDLYRSVGEPLSREMLFRWHQMVSSGRQDLKRIGSYRTGLEPMQVVSGADYARKVHFEAPPSKNVPTEMRRYIDWFNRTAPGQPGSLPPVTRSGIAHLYFESIHPFEDGNGRIGRVLAEKALVQGFGQTALIALAPTILAHHREYYEALEKANRHNEISAWLAWFAGIVLEAQRRTQVQLEFTIAKTRLLDSLRGCLNDRQMKVLLRMFQEGPEGFRGGMTASKYSTIAGSSASTTTRDLAGLVEFGALMRTGELRHTRYELAIPLPKIPRVIIGPQGQIEEKQ